MEAAGSSTLDVVNMEKDAEELDEDYFRTLTNTMITHAVKKRSFFDSFEGSEDDDEQTDWPKRKCEYTSNISCSDEFHELEQERRLIKTSLHQVKQKRIAISSIIFV